MPKKTETTFEDELGRLEEAVEALEAGELDLDKALARFEEGVALVRKLRARLDAAEGRIEELLGDGSTRRLQVD